MNGRIRCEAVPAASVGHARLLADAVAKATWRGFAGFCSPERAWSLLEPALVQRIDAREGFSVPLAMAMRGLGAGLEVDMPLAALQMRTFDWVQCGDRITHVGRWFVTTAHWRNLIHPARPSSVMREASHLRKVDLNYRETASYRRYLELIEQGHRITRNHVPLDSIERLDDYFERFARLYRSIETHGVLRARDVRMDSRSMPGSTAPGRTTRQGLDADIGIAIGPRGQIAVLPGAKHRLAVATVLKLRKVPVEVRLVHAAWLHRISKHRLDLDPKSRLIHAIQRLPRKATRIEAVR